MTFFRQEGCRHFFRLVFLFSLFGVAHAENFKKFIDLIPVTMESTFQVDGWERPLRIIVCTKDVHYASCSPIRMFLGDLELNTTVINRVVIDSGLRLDDLKVSCPTTYDWDRKCTPFIFIDVLGYKNARKDDVSKADDILADIFTIKLYVDGEFEFFRNRSGVKSIQLSK